MVGRQRLVFRYKMSVGPISWLCADRAYVLKDELHRRRLRVRWTCVFNCLLGLRWQETMGPTMLSMRCTYDGRWLEGPTMLNSCRPKQARS